MSQKKVILIALAVALVTHWAVNNNDTIKNLVA